MRRSIFQRLLILAVCFSASTALYSAVNPTPCSLHPAFQREDPLSQKEIEELRDTNRLPNERVMAFIRFMDERTETIRKLSAGPRHPGREQDIHDTLEQFTAIADNLEDNLNEYGPRHRDIRKALPKLLRAIDRWSSVIKSPPDDDAYNISRKLALESIRDLREDTERLIEDQKIWFAAHPPQKDAEGNVLEQ
ncbi:hypothetical protein [Granulicella aggregans]|uniref:hypothetical protein n=1 Tax=Granulicella aggregans TaxID=474949 RepID=UPI0021DF4B69|nr:hypothetical protein [Granulicella aggregans]